MLGGCTLSEFDSNATDFVEKIKEFPVGPETRLFQHREFRETNSIPGQVVLLGHHKGGLGNPRFVQELDPSFSQDDRNLPAVFEVSENGESKGTICELFQ